MEQTEKYLCGNIFQIKNRNGQRFIVMSNTSYKGFTKDQLKTLSKHGKLIVFPLDVIEKIGGGSARCMI